MNDELDRIRPLRGDPPAPFEDWVADTRAELLAMAAEEEQERRNAGPARLRARWNDFVGGWRPSRPVPAWPQRPGPSCCWRSWRSARC